MDNSLEWRNVGSEESRPFLDIFGRNPTQDCDSMLRPLPEGNEYMVKVATDLFKQGRLSSLNVLDALHSDENSTFKKANMPKFDQLSRSDNHSRESSTAREEVEQAVECDKGLEYPAVSILESRSSSQSVDIQYQCMTYII
jgi:hypothetical protein